MVPTTLTTLKTDGSQTHGMSLEICQSNWKENKESFYIWIFYVVLLFRHFLAHLKCAPDQLLQILCHTLTSLNACLYYIWQRTSATSFPPGKAIKSSIFFLVNSSCVVWTGLCVYGLCYRSYLGPAAQLPHSRCMKPNASSNTRSKVTFMYIMDPMTTGFCLMLYL